MFAKKKKLPISGPWSKNAQRALELLAESVVAKVAAETTLPDHEERVKDLIYDAIGTAANVIIDDEPNVEPGTFYSRTYTTEIPKEETDE